MAGKKDQRMATESTLFAALRTRYPDNAYALFHHVRSTTGTSASRTADAIAFSLWPSRGLELEGFEMKSSRSDWLREKDAPEKADEIAKFCDRWWLVIADEKIVQDGELPPTWGLLVYKKDKLVCRKQAPKLDPKPMERGFIASLFRNIQATSVPKVEINAKIEDASARGRELGSQLKGRYSEIASEELECLKKSIEEFKKTSGIEIDRWNGGRLGEAVNFVLRHSPKGVIEQIKRLRNSLQDNLNRLDKDLQYVEEVVNQDGRESAS